MVSDNSCPLNLTAMNTKYLSRHFLDEMFSVVIGAYQPRDVPHVDAYGARVVFGPLELVHKSLSLPIKIDCHKLAICIQHRRPAVAPYGICAVQTTNGCLDSCCVLTTHFQEPCCPC